MLAIVRKYEIPVGVRGKFPVHHDVIRATVGVIEAYGPRAIAVVVKHIPNSVGISGGDAAQRRKEKAVNAAALLHVGSRRATGAEQRPSYRLIQTSAGCLRITVGVWVREIGRPGPHKIAVNKRVQVRAGHAG